MAAHLSTSHRFAIAVPLLWLVVCVGLPVAILLGLSFAEVADSIPPVRPLLQISGGTVTLHATTQNYALMVHDSLYGYAFWNGLGNALQGHDSLGIT